MPFKPKPTYFTISNQWMKPFLTSYFKSLNKTIQTNTNFIFEIIEWYHSHFLIWKQWIKLLKPEITYCLKPNGWQHSNWNQWMKSFKPRLTYYLKPIDDNLKSTYKLKQMIKLASYLNPTLLVCQLHGADLWYFYVLWFISPIKQSPNQNITQWWLKGLL